MLLGLDEGSMRTVRTPEATQEIDARDVLEVTDIAPEDVGSSPSLMRVSYDLPLDPSPLDRDGSAGTLGQNEETCQIRLAARRRELARYVIGAVAISCAILVASFVKHESGLHDRGMQSAASMPHPAAIASPAPAIPAVPSPSAAPVSAPVAAEPPATGSGTLRFAAPAKSGWIWLDGKKLTGLSAIVSCGAHQVKVGYRAKHAVIVPCGGELVVTR
jgi:hypothetical protein